MSGVVYEVARWAEVFETAESRKYKTLTWISERTNFDSTGWQAGLDEFGPVEWPRVYGNWMIILRVAATAKVRGRLSGDKSEAWSTFRIARPSGCDPVGINEAFLFAVKIGWLIPVDVCPEESPGDLPEQQEIHMATKRNGTRQNETKRNGTEPDEAATVPVRAVIQDSANPNRPDSEPLHVRAARIPLLQQLSEVPVTGSGVVFHGSVFRTDRLKPEHVLEGDTAFWVKWYQDQLTATNPVFRCANRAELCYILAAVYAARKCTESSLQGHKRIARLITWLKTKETSSITDADFTRAASAIAKHFGDDPPGKPPGDPQAVSPANSPPPAAATSPYKPDKAKSAAALKRIRENGLKVAGLK